MFYLDYNLTKNCNDKYLTYKDSSKAIASKEIKMEFRQRLTIIKLKGGFGRAMRLPSVNIKTTVMMKLNTIE